MKRTILLSLLLIGGLGAAFSPVTNAFATQDEHGEHDEEGPIHEGMSKMNRAMRTLRKSLRDESRNAESLQAIVEAQRGASLAKTETPGVTAKQPESERAAFVVEYRLEIIRVERALLDLEEAVLAGDNEKAQELLKSAKSMEGPGHERFTEEEH
jgi:hypothetical protein